MMERYDVMLSDQAELDIRQTIRYISYTLCEKNTAEHMMERIMDAVDSLREMPERYPLVRDRVLAGRGIRMRTVGKYLIFFRVNPGDRIVTVERVLYGKRNWLAMF